MEAHIAWIGYVPFRNKPNSVSLESKGISVDEFTSPGKGLRALVNKAYSLVILPDWFETTHDLDTPEGFDYKDITGITCYVLERIRQTQGYTKTPIIIYSLRKPEEDNRRLKESGATEIFNALESNRLIELPRLVKSHL